MMRGQDGGGEEQTKAEAYKLFFWWGLLKSWSGRGLLGFGGLLVSGPCHAFLMMDEEHKRHGKMARRDQA